MIKLDISTALFLYLLSTVVTTFLLWIWFDRDSKLKAFKVEHKNIWQCSVCKYVYANPKDEELSRCPRCKSINKKGV